MIGAMIARVRKEKGMKKTELSSLTNINIGHLTHIEKEERNPSHKALRQICKALNVPYQPLMYTYDKILTEEQEAYHATNYISYNKVIAVDSIADFIDCPPSVPSSAIAFKIVDNSMDHSFDIGSYAFLEPNTPLNPKEIGLFRYNGQILVRRFSLRRGKIMLRPENKDYEEIQVKVSDDFLIIGKVLR